MSAIYENHQVSSPLNGPGQASGDGAPTMVGDMVLYSNVVGPDKPICDSSRVNGPPVDFSTSLNQMVTVMETNFGIPRKCYQAKELSY